MVPSSNRFNLSHLRVILVNQLKKDAHAGWIVRSCFYQLPQLCSNRWPQRLGGRLSLRSLPWQSCGLLLFSMLSLSQQSADCLSVSVWTQQQGSQKVCSHHPRHPLCDTLQRLSCRGTEYHATQRLTVCGLCPRLTSGDSATPSLKSTIDSTCDLLSVAMHRFLVQSWYLVLVFCFLHRWTNQMKHLALTSTSPVYFKLTTYPRCELKTYRCEQAYPHTYHHPMITTERGNQFNSDEL